MVNIVSNSDFSAGREGDAPPRDWRSDYGAPFVNRVNSGALRMPAPPFASPQYGQYMYRMGNMFQDLSQYSTDDIREISWLNQYGTTDDQVILHYTDGSRTTHVGFMSGREVVRKNISPPGGRILSRIEFRRTRERNIVWAIDDVKVEVLPGRAPTPPAPPPEVPAPTPPPPTPLRCQDIPLPGIPVVDQIIVALCWIFSPLFNALNSAVYQAGIALGPHIQSLQNTIAGWEIEFPDIRQAISDGLSGIWEGITGHIIGWLDAVGIGPGGMKDKTVEALSPSSPEWKDEISSAVKGFTDTQVKDLQAAWDQVKPPGSYPTAVQIAAWRNTLVSASFTSYSALLVAWAASEIGSIGQIDRFFDQAKHIIDQTGLPAAARAIQASTLEYGVLPWVRYYANMAWRPRILEPEEAVEMHLRGLITSGQLGTILGLHGYQTEEESIFLANRVPHFPPGEADRLFFRGAIDQATWEAAYRWARYPADRIAAFSRGRYQPLDLRDADQLFLRGAIAQTTWEAQNKGAGLDPALLPSRLLGLTAIPGPADLIRFLVREVITVEEFGELMSKLGYGFGETQRARVTVFTEAGREEKEVALTAARFWNAHWIPPGRSELFSMRHRGLINDEELIRWLAIIDVDPRMIDNVAALRFRLPGRIESRLIYETVGATDAQLTEWLAADGLRPDLIPAFLTYVKGFPARMERRRFITVLRKAFGEGKISADSLRTEILGAGYPRETAEWIIRTEEARIRYGVGSTEVIEEAEFTKADAEALFRSGIIDETAYLEILEAKGYSETARLALLELARTRLPREPAPPDRAITKSEIEGSYRVGLISEAEARMMLSTQGYDSTEIDFLIRFWQSRIPAERPPPDLALTKSELLSMRQRGLLTDQELTQEFRSRGYDNLEISRLFDLSDMQIVDDERKALRSAALADFVDGFIDEGTLRANLEEAMFQPAEVELFISASKMRRDRDRGRDLIKIYTLAYQRDLISEDEFRIGLAGVNLLSERVEDIIALENIRKVPKPKPARAPPAKDLTLAQLFSAWKAQLLSDADLTSELVRRGYSEDEAALLIETERVRMGIGS